MKDSQEEKLGMYIKVDRFLDTNSTPLSAVSQIATERALLHGYISDIADDEGIISSKSSPAQDKLSKRTTLKEIMLKTATAITAYYLSLGDPDAFAAADYSKTAINNADGPTLYAKAKDLFALATLLGTSLVNFNYTAADLSALDTGKENFFLVMQAPIKKRRTRKQARAHLLKTFGLADACLDRVNIYMATFENAQPKLFKLFKNQRSIDNTGRRGKTLLKQKLNIPAKKMLNINLDKIEMKGGYKMMLINADESVVLSIGFGADAASIADPVSLDAGKKITKTAEALGFDSSRSFLNIRNDTSQPGTFEIRIRS